MSAPDDDRRNLMYRRCMRLAARGLIRPTVRGVENVPRAGGVLLAMNHLGDADPVLVVGFTPRAVAVLGKVEILDWPVCVTLTFGSPFDLPAGVKRREAAGLIMRRIAALLPPEYRGAYADAVA